MPHIESGLITLIGATTENPSFEIITPLLSRVKVMTLKPLEDKDIQQILTKAIEKLDKSKLITNESIKYLAHISSGDARVALGNLELVLGINKGRLPQIPLTPRYKKSRQPMIKMETIITIQ